MPGLVDVGPGSGRCNSACLSGPPPPAALRDPAPSRTAERLQARIHQRIEDASRLIDGLPTGSLAVDLDPGGLIAGGYDPAQAVAALGSHILHVHATDAVRGTVRPRESEIPLGRGSADYEAILAGLEERGYRGYFTLKGLTRQNPAEEIAQAVQYLRNL